MNDWIRRVRLSTIYRSLLLLGGGLGFLGEKFSISILTNLALVCISLLFILVGFELILTKKAEFALGGWAYIQGRETFQGLAAQLWGIMFLGIGLLAMLVTIAQWILPAQMNSLLDNLQRSSAGAGLALTGLGLIAILYGTIRLLAGGAGLDLGRLTGLSNFMDRLGGCLVLLIGLPLALFGLLLIIAPNVVSALLEQIKILIFGN
jgi:hypothetical protein